MMPLTSIYLFMRCPLSCVPLLISCIYSGLFLFLSFYCGTFVWRTDNGNQASQTLHSGMNESLVKP